MIPQSIRNRIGGEAMQPIVRVSRRAAAADPWERMDRLAVPEDAEVTVDMAVDAIPSREAVIPSFNPTPERFPQANNAPAYINGSGTDSFDEPGAHNWAYLVQVGYLVDGVEWLEDMGAYLIHSFDREGDIVTGVLHTPETRLGVAVDTQGRWNLSPGPGDEYRAGTMTVQRHVTRILEQVLGDGPIGVGEVIQAAAPLFTPENTVEAWGCGFLTNVWDSIVGVIQAGGLRLYPDDRGRWIIARALRTALEPRVTLTDGPGGTLLAEPRQTLIRDGYLGGYIVRHSWVDDQGTQWNLRGRDGREFVTWDVVTVEDRTEPTTIARANAYAKSRRAAINSAVSQWTFTAVMMPWLRPDDTIAVTIDGHTSTYFIMRISFDVFEGTMTLTTREA